MPGAFVNQASMTIVSSGTTAFALSVAVSNFNTFANAGIGGGDIVSYGAIDPGTINSEAGWGVYTSTGSSTGGPSLTRNPLSSTNGNNLVSFSSSATQVFVDVSAADAVQLSLMAHANLGGI